MKTNHFFFARICAVIAFLAISAGAFSQTLQFSKVLLITVTDTVPAGKVWKVESVIYSIPYDQSSVQVSGTTSCGVNYYRSTAISLNGVPTKVGSGTQPAGYSNLDYTHSYTVLPIWLPAGATLSGGPCNNQVSVIEFTIIP